MMFSDASGTQLVTNGTMCMKFIDTEQEKEIDLGVSWPYEKLEPGECIISADFDDEVKVGDKVQILISWTNFWNNLGLNEYNEAA